MKKGHESDSNEISSEIMAKVRQIEIRSRRIVKSQTLGAWHASFKGTGLEFSEIREYQEGDDTRAIDWNVSARTGHPHIKLFTEEREQNVFLLADCSASLDFGTRGAKKREVLAEIAAVLAFSATLNKDRVGLMLHSDHEEMYVKPGRGHRHVLRIVRELLAFRAESKGTDLAAAMENLCSMALKRSIVFVLTDLISSDFVRPLQALTQRHEVIFLHLQDPMEKKIPKLPRFARLALEDLEDGSQGFLPASRIPSLSKKLEQERAAVASDCRRCGADYLALDISVDYVSHLIGLFDRRVARRV